MAYAHVQTIAGAAQTLTASITLTTGNSAIIWGMFTTGAGSVDFTVDDGHSGTWQNGVDSNAANYRVRSKYIMSAPAGVTVITIAWDAATPGEYGIVVQEFSGLASYITGAAQAQSSPGTGADAVTSGVANVTSQPALIAGYAFNEYSAINVGTTDPLTSRLSSAFGGNLRVGDKRATATGNNAATFTSPTGTGNFSALMMAFAETAAGGAAPRNLLLLGVG